MANQSANKSVGRSLIPTTFVDNGDGTYAEKVTTRQSGTKTFAAVSVGTTPTSLAAASTTRKLFAITNNSGATVYLGKDTNLTTANGFALPAGATFVDGANGVTSTDAWYAIVASSTSDVRTLAVS